MLCLVTQFHKLQTNMVSRIFLCNETTKLVILSEAKDLLFSWLEQQSGSFASLRMTILAVNN